MVEEREVDTDVILLHGLPTHIGVGQDPRSEPGYLGSAKEILDSLELRSVRIVTYRGLVTGQTIAGAEFEIRKSECFLKPMLFAHSPCYCYGREIAPSVFLGKPAGTISAEGSSQ